MEADTADTTSRALVKLEDCLPLERLLLNVTTWRKCEIHPITSTPRSLQDGIWHVSDRILKQADQLYS